MVFGRVFCNFSFSISWNVFDNTSLLKIPLLESLSRTMVGNDLTSIKHLFNASADLSFGNDWTGYDIFSKMLVNNFVASTLQVPTIRKSFRSLYLIRLEALFLGKLPKTYLFAAKTCSYDSCCFNTSINIYRLFVNENTWSSFSALNTFSTLADSGQPKRPAKIFRHLF